MRLLYSCLTRRVLHVRLPILSVCVTLDTNVTAQRITPWKAHVAHATHIRAISRMHATVPFKIMFAREGA